jgi:hypothetical protein
MKRVNGSVENCDFEDAIQCAVYLYQRLSVQLKHCPFLKTVGNLGSMGSHFTASVSSDQGTFHSEKAFPYVTRFMKQNDLLLD